MGSIRGVAYRTVLDFAGRVKGFVANSATKVLHLLRQLWIIRHMANVKTTYMPTARIAVEKAGGAVGAAKAADVHRSQVYRWMDPKETGWAEGMIPAQHQRRLLDAGLGITPDDFWIKIERIENGTTEEKR
jgi:hypothetical protein